MRILIIRHGEPDYTRDCLTPLGHLQAQAAARRLQEEGIREIFSSPMGRARETASYTADLLGIQPIQLLDFMHELHWGSSDGTPLFADGNPWMIADELVRRGWDLNDTSWTEHEFFRNNTVTAACAAVARETDRWLQELGYRREGLYYRNTRSDDKQYSVALFCHGGSSSALIAHAINQTFPYVCATEHAAFTGITILRLDRNPGSLCIPSLEIACDARHSTGLTAASIPAPDKKMPPSA